MTFIEALVVAAVPSIAGLVAAFVGLRDLGLRRRLEVSRQFLLLFAAANGRPHDRENIGVDEQVATVHLIADFAESDKLLRHAARAGLLELSAWEGSDQAGKVSAAARVALERLETGR